MGNGNQKGKIPPPTTNGATNNEPSPKPTLSPEEIAKREKRAKQRQQNVNELLKTERTYVRLLELCIIHFMMPLDSASRGHNPSVSQRGSIFQRYTTDTKSPSTTSPNSPTSQNSTNGNDMKTMDEKENTLTSPKQQQQQQQAQTILNGPHPFPNAYKIMNLKHHRLIFSDLKTICALNQTFLQGLEAIIDGGAWDPDKARLSDPFEKFSPFFTMYQNYMNNYEAATECCQIYSKKSDFQEFEDYARKQCDGQNLASLMILPIQRLPRYKLLLSEIVKNTEEEHVDYESLKISLNKIGEITTLINERMKEYTARANVRKMEARFMGAVNWVKPARSFIQEGKLTKIDRTGKAELLHFLLFSDMLVYASEVLGSSDDDSNLKLRQELPINKVFSVKNIEKSQSKKHNFENRGFEIYSSVKSFIVYAQTLKEKQDWMKVLSDIASKQQEILSNRQSTTNKEESKSEEVLFPAALLIPDDYSDVCMRCGTKFTTINRRHHCRYCGFIVCGKCGNHQLASRLDKTKIAKLVCTVCYDQYKDQYPRPKSGQVEKDNDDDSGDEKSSHGKTSSMAKLGNMLKGKKLVN